MSSNTPFYFLKITSQLSRELIKSSIFKSKQWEFHFQEESCQRFQVNHTYLIENVSFAGVLVSFLVPCSYVLVQQR
jgi:hypothetical protein